MSEFFLKIVNMSISATWLVLAVIVLRLCLKHTPKWVHVLLWGIVAVRLICPISIESALSLIPSAETFPEQVISGPDFNIQSGIPPVDDPVNDYLDDHYFEGVTVPTNHGHDVMTALTVLWLMGVLVLAAYTAVSYFRLRRRVRTATGLYGNIYLSAHIPSPFVLGFFRPRIYLPCGMQEGDMAHVIAHEQTHIRRLDHWWKPIGFLLLTVHWFNPIMWVAYILLCRDIELACDEKVIAQLCRDQRADYSQALLKCSVDRRMIAACPLAFGEVGVKERVKNVLRYQKPAFWVIVLAVILCIIVAVCFLTDPEPSREFSMDGENVSALDPEAIVERIIDIEDIKYSGVHMNSMNFDLHVDSDFNWLNSQTVRYFFGDSKKTYSAQLRLFPDEGTYFLTEPTEWPEQERIFLLRHYLEAIKYLPQNAIRQMAPADQYMITHIDGGRPADYDRVITYTPDGAGEIDGWFIHLELQPLHETDGAYRGEGNEVIHLFYGDGQLNPDSSLITWIDDEQMNIYNLAEQTIRLPEFEGITFHYYAPAQVGAEDANGFAGLINGSPIWNVYFADLNGDRRSEICATVSLGSGLVDTRVVVLDYANGQEYILSDRGVYDYYLRVEDEKLLCEQRRFLNGGIYKGDLLACGELMLVDAGGGEGKRLTIDSPELKSYIVSIEDRAETEQLPTDEALEVFYVDTQYTYSFSSIRSHLVMVTYYDGRTEDIKTALEAGRVAISDLDRFGIQYYAEPKVIPMEPTRTNLRGLVNGYVFVPINGATYRYLLTDPRPQNVTAEALLDTFDDETDIEGIAWDVYSLKEYPDKTKLLMVSGTNSTILCEYAPSLAAEEEALEAAREAGYVIVENGTLTGNAEVWQDFYQAAQQGKPGFISVAHYFTLDPDRTDSVTYEASRQDYPALYILELSYDGESFVLRTESDVRVYEYLMKYTGTYNAVSSAQADEYTHYVLTHDNTVTWEQIWNGLLSSAYGASIDHYTVCTELY